MTQDRTRHPALWGAPADALPTGAAEDIEQLLAARFPGTDLAPEPIVDPSDVAVPDPRLLPPAALAGFCRTDGPARLLHATGRSYSDLVRARRGDYGVVPDVVACPRDDGEVAAVLDWCDGAGAICIPFGGGTSVVGGVNAPAGEHPVVTLQTRSMAQVLDVDPISRMALIQAGAAGPVVEEQLRPSGLTLRFYPQSYEYSTLGGWIATRAGGHYATGPTHIDDLVVSVTAVTPAGLWSSSRLPASGAGPSPDRLLLGSEGTMGVVTEAWMRLTERPRRRASASVHLPSMAAGSAAVRAIVQSGLTPAGCRLLDPMEAALNGAGSGEDAILILAFEATESNVDPPLAQAVELCRDAGGSVDDSPVEAGPGRQWRDAFLQAPYLRDVLIGMGMIVETFETATTWDRFDELVAGVTAATRDTVRRICGDGEVTCRITHAYPGGAAPYFTVVAPGRRGDEAAQWHEVKTAASDAIAAAGGTITHHHAVGRDHRPWYDRQRPAPFASALRAAKAAVDPAGILNPGVLFDP